MESGVVAPSSVEDLRGNDVHKGSLPHRKRSQHRIEEASILTKHVSRSQTNPTVPLWDAGTSCWASWFFMWSTSDTHIFSTALDLGFLSAFGKTIMAERSRLDALLANKQKADSSVR